jgi:UDP-glucuronate 4-epimerase
VSDPVEQPVSLYAATKRAGELLTQSYSHLYGIPATGLRFFTVYGPWGRPDMAYFSFTRDILEGKSINIYNHGQMRRDFTWIEDIVEGIVRVTAAVPEAGGIYTIGGSRHRLFNLGNNRSENLLEFVETIEQALGKKAHKVMRGMAQGDVKETFADIEASRQVFGYHPQTPISVGIPKFVEWYKDWQNRT